MGYCLEHRDYAVLVTDRYGREYFSHVIAYDKCSAISAALSKLGFTVDTARGEILEWRQLNRI